MGDTVTVNEPGRPSTRPATPPGAEAPGTSTAGTVTPPPAWTS
jgi:hypothetical protein